MAQGYKDFTAGAVLTAADLEDYNQNQSIMRFASAAARDSALNVVKTEGMMAYLIDVNTLTVYSGAAWSTVGPVHGAQTGWTPAIVQSGAVTCTVTRAVYSRIGRLCIGDVELAVTGSGTGNNLVSVSTPVTMIAPSTSVTPVGAGLIYDASVPTYYPLVAVLGTASTFRFFTSEVASNVYVGQTGAPFLAALASGDKILLHFACEAAADA